MDVHVYVYTHVHTHTYVCRYIYIYIGIYIYVCVYIYIHIFCIYIGERDSNLLFRYLSWPLSFILQSTLKGLCLMVHDLGKSFLSGSILI